ncbi:S-formylglutathione hydrolase [Sandarakinorhabdus limnophila]|uniref:S-formylglutathione hydrolase n=1 Tax=Sandarakinorhabdus limnophila TaxID=210512 RepID=UPI0026EE4C86|nr:S-formylglutathione hydrolase [Sandarakinorhabdus limnophila]MCM0033366.1 S-formylglutathione hydrolase [Sandarakinorhabdus limnophila]
METLSRAACHGGVQSFHSHQSNCTGTAMRFGVFVPPGNGPFPVLWCLAGLTCTEETFAIKAGAQRLAAELGLMLVTSDTSPRGDGVADDPAWDMGQAASFYLDATAEPWAAHFRMRTWLIDELPGLIGAQFPADMARQGITGHSMGGHGALTLALKHPGRFKSVSAFAPIVAPTQVPWGRKALPAYLGDDPAAWAAHDACALIDGGARLAELLVDQGEADAFLAEQLQPERLEVACARASIPLTLRRHAGYDHGYWFVQSFVADHLRWHAARLTA